MHPARLLWIYGTSRPFPPPAEDSWSLDVRTPTGALDRLHQTVYRAIVIDGVSAIFNPESYLQQIQDLTGGCTIFIRGVEPGLAARLTARGAVVVSPEDSSLIREIRTALDETPSKGPASRAEEVQAPDWEALLIGQSPPLRQVRHIIRLVGGRRANVLIHGRTGTGKEVAAHCLHLAGPRHRCPFVPVNCGALPENLMEAELFGHVRGAFTGATQNRAGHFEKAAGGTLFLDEIGELPLELQAKLLRVIQEREFQRLGSSETVKADVRLVAATNRDLRQRVEQGLFREDLYYRLNVVPLYMPPLCDCHGDIPLLARHFVEKICNLESIPKKELSSNAIERLSGFSWPGNVRQLENVIEMAIALSGARMVLTAADFPLPPEDTSTTERPVPVPSPIIAVPDQGLDFGQTVAFIERSILEQALRKTRGNKKAAAEMLRLKRTTLSAKVRNLEPEAACG